MHVRDCIVCPRRHRCHADGVLLLRTVELHLVRYVFVQILVVVIINKRADQTGLCFVL